MSLIPDEELRKQSTINLAPMVDFLFLLIAVFAVLAITRTALYDTRVNLAKIETIKEGTDAPAINDSYVINLTVMQDGRYKWISEFKEFLIEDVSTIKNEIERQQQSGLLPQEKEKTKVLLHIDKQAQWEPIAQVIFAVRESGYKIHPVYEPTDKPENL